MYSRFATAVAPVIEASPVLPVSVLLPPAAVSVQSVANASPTSRFSTTLTSVSFGALSVLTIVQVTAPPNGTEIVAPDWVPPSQLHEPAV